MNYEVEQIDSAGLSPLQRAVLSGDANQVALLIRRRADANRVVVSADGRLGTALMSAVTLRDPTVRLQIVQMLVAAGAAPGRLEIDGRNLLLHHVLDHAEKGSDITDLVRLLVDHGARPDPSLLPLAEEHSLFNVEYLFRRNIAVTTPVEEGSSIGCCLVPLVSLAVLSGIVFFFIHQYTAR